MDERWMIRSTVAALSVVLAAGLAATSAEAQQRQGETEYHEVDEGDTLYDLSGQYFGDNKQWPKLWSYNPHITNPHWIYPGDIVYLNAPSPGKDQQKKAESKKGEFETGEDDAEQVEGLRVSTVGYIREDRTAYVGRIMSSPKEGRMLGEYDSAWVAFGDESYDIEEAPVNEKPDDVELTEPESVEKGQRYAVVETGGELENNDGDVIGHKYIVLGSLVVTKTSDEKLNTALIDQSWREIERGDFLVPYEKQLKLVDHTKAKNNLVAEIIDSLGGHRNFAQSHYLFIDKGASDGVRPGNRLYIYQREAGLSVRWEGDEAPEEIPWQRIGHIRVLDTTENFSTAIVVSSKSEIQIGDRLEMYKGD